MNFIEWDEILSTTLLYDGFCNYSEFLKISKYGINDLFDKVYNVEEKLHTREFIYKLKNTFTINKIILPVSKGDTISYEIYDVIDSEKDNEKILNKVENIFIEKDELEININNIELDNLKIRMNSKKNIYPRLNEISIMKSNS